MLDHIGHVLYHVLIVIFPILLYYLLVIQDQSSTPKLHSNKLLGMIIVILLLTMSFPVSYANGFSYDFRIIPIFVTLFYIGLFRGMAVILIMLIYSQILGDSGLFIISMNYVIIAIIFYFLLKKYHSLLLNKKLMVLSAIYGFIVVTRTITLVKNNQSDQILVMFIFSTITWITLLLVVLLIENVNQQILLQKELRHSEKMNVISQLAASVAHEVRNPLTTVNGFLQLIMRDDNITEKQRNYIDITLSELYRAQSIINDYLSLAKPNNSSTQLINISEELAKTVELMTSYSNIQNIEVKTSIENFLFINGSKDEIKQVLINIIKNAIEAIGNDGLLTIDAFSKDHEVVVEITDNGQGMTKEQLSKIGTPFYSTKDKGTGVGLTICFQIIEQLKGSIEVESAVGKGTSFIIKLPTYHTPSNSK
ncbi:ATP-binding protein [Bacillus sp. REN16]|uniref:ATP-binding protein n=1 Tax=Bacillus sp. REN16 TaxID=2887296 RepID=UPI001E2B2F7E|nr:ATP-binding protein [Bacillus sp. REN16]MCC3355688.1 sporulation kinase [Bacillus sp. REN16]